MFESINGTRQSTVSKDINTKEIKEYKKLSELVGKEVNIYGFLITKEGKFGRNVLLVAKDYFITLPKRYVDPFRALSIEEIEHLTSGNAILKDIKPLESKNGDTTVFNIE